MDHGFGNWPTIHALRNPSRPAFIDAATGHVSTWVEFEERTNRLAEAMSARGVSPGDRVGLLTLNSVAMMEIYFAVAKLGAISVPINARLTASEVNYILRDSGVSFVFESSVLSGVMDEAIGDTSIRERVVVPAADSAADSGVPSAYEQFLQTGQPHRVEREVVPTPSASSCTRRAPPASQKVRCSPTTISCGTPSTPWVLAKG